MMPRSTSVVPPWIVSFGAIAGGEGDHFVERVVRAVSAAGTPRGRAPVRQPCSQSVPTSFTIAPPPPAPCPPAACRPPRPPCGAACGAARRGGRALGATQVRLVPEHADQLEQHREVSRKRSGPLRSYASSLGACCHARSTSPITWSSGMNASSKTTSLKSRCPLMSAIGFTCDPWRLHVDEELRQPVTPVLLRRRRGAKQADHVVRVVRAGGPDLRAVDEEATVGRRRLRARGEKIRA